MTERNIVRLASHPHHRPQQAPEIAGRLILKGCQGLCGLQRQQPPFEKVRRNYSEFRSPDLRFSQPDATNAKTIALDYPM